MIFPQKANKPRLISFDLTPAIDAVFNLIIFFLVTLTMKPPIDSKINLPQTIHYDEQKNTEIKIYITAASVGEKGIIIAPGEIYINQEKVTLETLKEEIYHHMKLHNKKKLIIKADQKVFYLVITEIMKLAKRAGINEIAIATSSKIRGVGGIKAFKYYGEK